MTVVTEEELAAAAFAVLGKRLDEGECKDVARKAMKFFGFDDSVIDNSLHPKDRDVFYLLEEAGLVTTLEDETYLERGKKWRIHYWVLNKEKIKHLAINGSEKEKEVGSVYEEWNEDWVESREKDI